MLYSKINYYFTKIIGICLFFFGITAPVYGEEYLLQQVFDLGKNAAYSAEFNPTGQHVTTLATNHQIEIRSFPGGTRLKAISTEKHQATVLVLHPDDNTLITGGTDNTINIWSQEQGVVTRTLREHMSPITSLALDRTGSFLVSGDREGTLVLWDLKQFSKVAIIKQAHQGTIRSLSFHPNGHVFASGGDDSKIRIWEVPTLKPLNTFKGHSQSITHLSFTPTGDVLVSSSLDKTLKSWNWKQEKFLKTFTGHTDEVRSFDIDSHGETVISGGMDHSLRIWNLKDGTLRSEITTDAPVIQLHLDASNRQIAVSLEQRFVQFWTLGSSEKIKTFDAHQQAVTSLQFSNHDKYLISSSFDKTFKIWDLEQNTSLRIYPTEQHQIQEILLHPNGKELLRQEVMGRLVIGTCKRVNGSVHSPCTKEK